MKASIFCRIRRAAVVGIMGMVGISWIGAARVDAATIHVSMAGNDGNDGLTWPSAKRTVQAGLNAAAEGDQVWVAAGTYVENITLAVGIGLYGGFAGGETDLPQRNWRANLTVLHGDATDSVVTAPSSAGAATRIDGFVIRNGGNKSFTGLIKGGGGIYCLSYSSPTIANNTIVGNSPTLAGGGVYCDFGSCPTITNNAITSNTASSGGGIYCYAGSSPTIENNRIMGNSSCGICCIVSSPMVLNNTIVGNNAISGGGIYSDALSSPTIVNTIIAFNISGVYKESGTGAPVLCNNCVYGNTAYDYSGVTDPTGTGGNICSDPVLADLRYGNVHIQPDSPCVDAGDDSAVQADWRDIDGQARINGSHVDIGADESDGTVWPAGPNVIVRASPSGDDANDGSSWALAKRTVQEGIDAAAAAGGEVWVAAGTYVERITLRNFAHLYGGFAGTETQLSARNWLANATILDGAQAGSVVTADRLGRDLSTIDGFTIRNGTGTRKATGYPVTYYVYYGGGIYCTGPVSPRIANNRVSGNTATYGGGICCKSAPTILNNTVTGNTATYGGGIYSQGEWSYMVGHVPHLGASGTVAGNLVAGNTSVSYGGGIYCVGSVFMYSPRVANNIVAGNSAGSCGGGIYCDDLADAQIANDTITDNAAPEGGGIYLADAGTSGSAVASNTIIFFPSPVVANTIIAFNSSGVYGGSSQTWRYNCVCGNTAYNYSGLINPTGTNGNISADPLFVRAASPGPDGLWGTDDDDYGDLRLLPGSPCIDAGSNADVPADMADLDGDGDTTEPLPVDLSGYPRFLDDPATPDCPWAPDTCGTPPIVDMGAYEFAADSDGDGVPDFLDDCPDSDLGQTIVINGVDTGVPNQPLGDGCTMADEIAKLAAGARNHGAFVNAVDQLTDAWVAAGLITDRQEGRIQSAAGRSRIPGDINADGFVDVSDLLILAGSFGKLVDDSVADFVCDLNADGAVDVSDLLILAANWDR